MGHRILPVAMLGLALAVPAALAQESSCRDRDASCWYLVGGTGEPPARIAWLARDAGRAADDRRLAEVVQVLEDGAAPHPYVIWRLQVDCVAGAMRAQERWLAGRDGLLVQQPPDAQWTPAAETRHGESTAMPLVCDPDVARGRSQTHVALFIGNAWRAPDAQSAFRQAFWEPQPTVP